MRTGILSDESVLAMCAEYRPIPLGQVERILKGKTDAEPSKLKHSQPPSRPAFFGAMSNSMAKEMDPTNPVPIRVAINEQYVNELSTPVVNVISNSPELNEPAEEAALEQTVQEEAALEQSVQEEASVSTVNPNLFERSSVTPLRANMTALGYPGSSGSRYAPQTMSPRTPPPGIQRSLAQLEASESMRNVRLERMLRELSSHNNPGLTE